VISHTYPQAQALAPAIGHRDQASRQDLSRAGPRWRGGAATIAVGAAVLGLLLFVLPVRHVRLAGLGGLGLISVLPITSLTGLALLVVAFVAMLARSRPHPVILAAMLLAVIFCLDGAAAIAEPLPRFATAYQIAGFVGYVSHNGQVAAGAAAYFSWPGFFALIAFAARAAGVHSLLPVLTWWPVILDALCLLPFMLITRGLRISWRARWLAALLFCAGNWVGQDYFSPQSFNYLLYLVFLAILLTWFGRQRAVPRRDRVQGEMAPRPASSAERAILLLVLLGIFGIATVSHQLTPFIMLAACAGLALARRCTLTGLPVLLGVILAGWISFGTVAYWSGHASTVFGRIGQLGANISSSVGDRLVGTPEHQLVLYSRIGFAGIMIVLALLGYLRRRRGRIDDRALLVLACVPAAAILVQNYGGEISLRIYLFALPAVAVLAATLFFPDFRPAERSGPARPPLRVIAAAGAAAVSLAGFFLLARYGNEAFEQTPRGEIAAMDYIYARDAGGGTVAWLSPAPSVNATPEMPWQYRDITRLNFRAVQAPRDPRATAAVVSALRGLPGGYLIITKTQQEYLSEAASYPAGWGARFRARMAATPGVRVIYANADAAVYALRHPVPARAPRPAARPAGSGMRAATLWTPAELAIFGIALLVLAGRELIRLCIPRWRGLLRPLFLAALPVLALFLLVVVERFVVLS